MSQRATLVCAWLRTPAHSDQRRWGSASPEGEGRRRRAKAGRGEPSGGAVRCKSWALTAPCQGFYRKLKFFFTQLKKFLIFPIFLGRGCRHSTGLSRLWIWPVRAGERFVLASDTLVPTATTEIARTHSSLSGLALTNVAEHVQRPNSKSRYCHRWIKDRIKYSTTQLLYLPFFLCSTLDESTHTSLYTFVHFYR